MPKKICLAFVALAMTAWPGSSHAEDQALIDARPWTGYQFTAPVDEPTPAETGAPMIIYMNKSGGTYIPGDNNSSTNRSSIPYSTSVVSPWNVSATGWAQVMDCVRDMFEMWNVTITDVDPGNAVHVESVVAGSPEDVGMEGNVGGVSPFTYDCSVIPRSIVFTFAEVYGNDYQAICETAAQEISHSYGLDHEHLCQDPMTYLYGCGDKSFQDIDADCGEYSARECACGGYTQNSVEMLTDVLGLAEQTNDPPTVQITSPADGATVAAGFTVAATASDDSAVSRVELWVDGSMIGSDTSAPYSFTTSASLVPGEHDVEARAFDAASASASDAITVTIEEEDPGDPPGDDDDDDPPGDDDDDDDPGEDPGDDDDDPGEDPGEGSGGDPTVVTGGCAAGGGDAMTLGAGLLAVALTLARRRRRA